jgi:hypothetical protein
MQKLIDLMTEFVKKVTSSLSVTALASQKCLKSKNIPPDSIGSQLEKKQ